MGTHERPEYLRGVKRAWRVTAAAFGRVMYLSKRLDLQPGRVVDALIRGYSDDDALEAVNRVREADQQAVEAFKAARKRDRYDL